MDLADDVDVEVMDYGPVYEMVRWEGVGRGGEMLGGL